MDFWVSGIKPKNRFFKRGKSGTKIFFIFSAKFFDDFSYYLNNTKK